MARQIFTVSASKLRALRFEKHFKELRERQASQDSVQTLEILRKV
jgi:hypothetical protein